MDAKLIAYFLAAGVLISLTFGVYYTQDIDDLSRELNSKEHHVENVGRLIQTQKQQLELRKEAAALIEANSAKEAERQALKAEIEALKNEQPRLAEEMAQAVEKARKASVGMTFPELVLVKGPSLKDARIQRVDEEVVTFQHSEGVARAKLDDLPADLRDRLRLRKIVPKELLPQPISQPAPKPEAATAGSKLSGSERKLLEARLARERLAKELPHARSAMEQAEADLTAATSASRKFYARIRRDQVSAQYLALKRSLDAADLALQRLQAEAAAEVR